MQQILDSFIWDENEKFPQRFPRLDIFIRGSPTVMRLRITTL